MILTQKNNKKNMRSIHKKTLNLMRNWKKKLEDLWNIIGEKPPNLQVKYFLRKKIGKDWVREIIRTFLST